MLRADSSRRRCSRETGNTDAARRGLGKVGLRVCLRVWHRAAALEALQCTAHRILSATRSGSRILSGPSVRLYGNLFLRPFLPVSHPLFDLLPLSLPPPPSG